MSKEQNIDDILKLLKDSVNTDTPQPVDEQQTKAEDISTEYLQETLKNKYIENQSSEYISKTDNFNEYIIDSDFLTDVESINSNDDLSEAVENEKNSDLDTSLSKDTEESSVLDENETIEIFDEEGITEASGEDISLIIEDNIDELDDYISNEAVILEAEINENFPEDNTDELIAALKVTEDTTPIYEDEEDDISYEFDEQEQIYASISINDDFETQHGMTVLTEIEQEIEAINDIQVEEEKHETFLASMRKSGLDFTTEEIYNSSIEKATQSNEIIEDSMSDETHVNEESAEEIDLSTINLMMQFCEQEEVEKTVGNEKVDDFLKFEDSTIESTQKSHVFNGKEYISTEQNQDILNAYKKRKGKAFLTCISCTLIAFIGFIYELMPLFGVQMGGLFDYTNYPSVYALVGLQFVVFAAVICYKQIWHGLKRAFSFVPNKYSIAAIIMSLTALYDIIIVMVLAFTNDDLPPMYNSLAVFVCTLCALADLLNISSELKSFNVYSSDSKKYTLVKETENSSIGSKMYNGGIDKEKVIYSAHSVDFPNGFFRSLEKRPQNKLLAILLIPVLVLGIICAIISVILGSDAYATCAVFMVCLYAVLPIALIVSDIIPYAIASNKLSKRSSAFAGRGTVEKYKKCDVMVFNDLHIFKKCKTEDVGIVIYDNGVGYLTLGCIDALYQKIGGPLSGMKMNLPDVFKFNHVTIKRISRNGIEAVIDKKHSLIVGDSAYMQRYGLAFPENENQSDRLTLCVSLNGKATAKLSVKYEIEPVFEMLAERLYAEGIACAIHTYDPLINGNMITKARKLGDAPISVIHRDAEEANTEKKRRYRNEEDAVISCSSRLKLVEVEIYLKRLSTVKKLCDKICIGFSVFGLCALILFTFLGIVGYINQGYILIYLLLEAIAISIPTILYIPSKKYFTVDALYSELEKKNQQKNK